MKRGTLLEIVSSPVGEKHCWELAGSVDLVRLTVEGVICAAIQ